MRCHAQNSVVSLSLIAMTQVQGFSDAVGSEYAVILDKRGEYLNY